MRYEYGNEYCIGTIWKEEVGHYLAPSRNLPGGAQENE
jgi:hypothetical protein